MEYKFELYLTDKEKELFKFYGDNNAEEFKTMLKNCIDATIVLTLNGFVNDSKGGELN